MKFRVEIHVKKSVLDDSIDSWVKSGRPDNRGDGSFIFENVEAVDGEGGELWITRGNDRYLYNMADLYRVKITLIKD